MTSIMMRPPFTPCVPISGRPDVQMSGRSDAWMFGYAWRQVSLVNGVKNVAIMSQQNMTFFYLFPQLGSLGWQSVPPPVPLSTRLVPPAV